MKDLVNVGPTAPPTAEEIADARDPGRFSDEERALQPSLWRTPLRKVRPAEQLPRGKIEQPRKRLPTKPDPHPARKPIIDTAEGLDARAPQPDTIVPIGSFSDQVTLLFVDRKGSVQKVVICEAYDVACGVFTQPAAFSLTLGHGGSIAEIMRLVVPRTGFQLKIGDTLVQSGYIDGYEAGGEAAIVNIHGRDLLQEVHDSFTPIERTFDETSYVEFVRSVFTHAGLGTPDVRFTDDGIRKAMAQGKPLPAPALAREEKKISKPVTMKLGDRYFDLIKRVLDRAGLFMIMAPDGRILLTAPNPNITALYRLVHAPKGPIHGNVVDFHFVWNTVDRVTRYVVYARGGGKKLGAIKVYGEYPDTEMFKLGYRRSHTFRDWNVQTNEQAEIMARRRIAEERRKGWQLNVTVAGHRTKLLGTDDWVVWRPDTMVRFDSDELDMHDIFYIEDVHYRRSQAGTRTELRLIRREDLDFGYEGLPDEP